MLCRNNMRYQAANFSFHLINLLMTKRFYYGSQSFRQDKSFDLESNPDELIFQFLFALN